ncbi:MAG: conjugal transfer protein TrbL, partial [Stutzerimonas stutzeri]
ASALASGGASLAYGYGAARDAHEGMLARGTRYTGRMIGRGARFAGSAFGSKSAGA